MENKQTPKKLGFHMPGEFEPHHGTFMIYPTRPGSWGKDRSKALKAFGDIFFEILKREHLYLLVDSEHAAEAGNFMKSILRTDEIASRLHIIEGDSDDAWARDVGPTFVKDTNGHLKGIDWAFNAWGGDFDGLYADWERDDKVASLLLDTMAVEAFDAHPFVLEGGSVHCDGEGTVLVTESCLLSKGRNPRLSKAQIEENLKEYLGADKVLWLPRGIYNDETNEHVDNVCAFTGPGRVVLASCDDKNDPQYEMFLKDLEYLESERDAHGRKLKIDLLPVPEHPVLVNENDLQNFEFEDGEDVREKDERLAASYVNFYFVNGAVLVPQFGSENLGSDKKALEILKSTCPGREVIGIPATSILLGGGNIHCITQQIPEFF